MKAILLGVLMVMGSLVYGQSTKKYEILTVEEWTMVEAKLQGLHIFRSGREPELIPMVRGIAGEDLLRNGKIREEAFTKLYEDGWRLILFVDAPHRYIFEREKP
jgi:hypothetical protein